VLSGVEVCFLVVKIAKIYLGKEGQKLADVQTIPADQNSPKICEWDCITILKEDYKEP
jgi:hypothetical protein